MTESVGKAPPFGFRAQDDLLKAVQAQAKRDKITLSDVTRAVLVEFVIAPESGITVGENNDSKAVALPEPITALLRGLVDEAQSAGPRSDASRRLNAYIAKLHEAGWSLGAIGHSLPITRQAVWYRARSGKNSLPVDGLPEVPPLSPYRLAPRSEKPGTAFSVHLDPTLQEQVFARAQREGASVLRVVAEGFAAYLAGNLEVQGKSHR